MPSRARVSCTGVFARIYDVVRAIPRGSVLTYGQVAVLAGIPRGARVVGYAMRASLPARVPWQRVVGRGGPGWARVTIRDPIGAALQRQRLEREGVRFGPDGAIDLERYGKGEEGEASRRTSCSRRCRDRRRR